MKPYQSQIRLHRWHTDEAQRRLAEAERLEQRLRDELAALESEAAREAANPPPFEARATVGAYAAAVVVRRQTLHRSIGQAAEQVAVAREGLRDAFAELKKFELAAEAAEERARREADRREQIQLDEVGLAQFRRKRAE